MTPQTKPAQHTPGPWHVAPAKGTLCAWRIELSSGFPVAFVAQTVTNNQVEDANARLIAAAPELLESLKALLAVVPLEFRAKHALQVIARAEGRQE